MVARPSPLLALLSLLALGPAAAGQCPLDKLTAGAGWPGGEFGQAVSASGEALFVGAHQTAPGGAVHVFRSQGGGWVELSALTGSDTATGDHFGHAVAVSGDWAVVGAPFDDDAGINSGSAYVFESVGPGWVERQKLTALDAAAGDSFGFSVAISGEVLVLGAPYDDVSRGSAYVFERFGSNWLQTGKLTAPDAEIYDALGWSVAVDGGRILCGVPHDDDGAGGAGSARVFEKPGTLWFQDAKLVAQAPGASHAFGAAVSLSGNTAAVGAPGDDSGGAQSGSVHVFDRFDTSWSFTQELSGTGGGQLGYAVAIGGGLIVAGAPYELALAGTAHLFELKAASWSEVAVLEAYDAAPGDEFGRAVSLSGDKVLVAAPEDDDTGAESGAAWIFSAVGSGCPSLFGSRDAVSLGDPTYADQLLFLQAGAGEAGNLYLLLGSSSGTAPGLPVDGLILPLKTPDSYFDFTLQHPNSQVLNPSLSPLDTGGAGLCTFHVPPGANPALAGTTLNHAYAVLQLVPFHVNLVSVAEDVTLLP